MRAVALVQQLRGAAPACGRPRTRWPVATVAAQPPPLAAAPRPVLALPPRPRPRPRRAVAARASGGALTPAHAAAGAEPPAGDACFAGCASLGWSASFASRFEMGAEVGRGSFGVVHRAVHRRSGREFAVKVVPKRRGGSPAGGSPAATACPPGPAGAAAADDEPCPADAGEQLDAISREAAAWAAMQGSAFVARLEGLYEDRECAFLLGELLTGGTVRDLLAARGGRLEEADAAAVMRGVFDVLLECHGRGWVYADVKPSNFLVASPDAAGGAREALKVRAVDFGCSRPAPLTSACGSPLYMAPELVTARRGGAPVDMWAAGVMLHQLLTGRAPYFPNLAAEQLAALPPYAIVAAVRTHDISFPRDAWRGISPEARALVAALLQRDPAARITAAEALAHPWLRRALGYAPQPSSGAAAAGGGGGAKALSNVVSFAPAGHPAPAAAAPVALAAAA
ncbi:CDPK-related kinase-like [Raphidocelis subcapitata]|uniref:CDPK-related kinase-like n=1 Tax=Raphidocelis subcapitata TaxID=307507 RepID=A0A2V0NW69_9CHLO|nr:CDPK-related kinase-like [Raphidocelis subcapitata]|eukprot:GBF90932.1 CDPK-related kinase-like [Raphidocelis subcapitata]